MNFDGSRLIFIVGHYKSGSTWLLNMLSLHPAIGVFKKLTFSITFGGRRICATARGRSTPPRPGAPADFVICQDMSCSRSSADFSARGPCFCCPYEIDRRLARSAAPQPAGFTKKARSRALRRMNTAGASSVFSGAISNPSDICWRRRRTMCITSTTSCGYFLRQDCWQSIATAATWLSRLAHS